METLEQYVWKKASIFNGNLFSACVDTFLLDRSRRVWKSIEFVESETVYRVSTPKHLNISTSKHFNNLTQIFNLSRPHISMFHVPLPHVLILQTQDLWKQKQPGPISSSGSESNLIQNEARFWHFPPLSRNIIEEVRVFWTERISYLHGGNSRRGLP